MRRQGAMLGRRVGSRGIGRGAIVKVQTGYAIGPLTTTNYYRTAVGEGPDGSTSFWVAVLLRIDANTGATQTIVANGNLGASNPGWGLRIVSSTVYLQMANSTPSGVNSPAYTILAGDVGKVHLFVGVHDGSNLRLYKNGAQVGGGTAITGYTGIAGSRYTSIGVRRTPAFGLADCRVLGIAASDVASLSPTNVTTLAASYKTAGNVTNSMSPEHIWDVKTNGQTAPTEWPDTVTGVENMDENGTVPFTGAFPITWGW